ncbi:MaoC family dehydratase [Thalassovita taeanensis]|uniref:MaoC like domain-containing protein n=1 Tax=Thalassovita taeanensis TaxID=657014 RepID=A0A1H9H951_9RHOB|nr:MaoC family dehydratase [Thalassovita taeanensis]SEQ58852.1 MaoC like domain-containing protein [Thalassovita taeanensis]
MSNTSYPTELPSMTLRTSAATTQSYAELTGDFNPLHLDPAFAAKTPFGQPIAHGTMSLNLLIESVARISTPALTVQDVAIKFVAPTPVGEALRTKATLTDAATGQYEVSVTRSDGVNVLEGTMRLSRKEAP